MKAHEGTRYGLQQQEGGNEVRIFWNSGSWSSCWRMAIPYHRSAESWVQGIASAPLILFGKSDSYSLETKLFIDSPGTALSCNTSRDFITAEVFISFHRLAAHVFFTDNLVFVGSVSFGHKGEACVPWTLPGSAVSLWLFSETIPAACNTSLPLVYRKFESSEVDLNIFVNNWAVSTHSKLPQLFASLSCNLMSSLEPFLSGHFLMKYFPFVSWRRNSTALCTYKQPLKVVRQTAALFPWGRTGKSDPFRFLMR